jgi:hypothetical protein
LYDKASIRAGYSVGIIGAFLIALVSHGLPALEPLTGKLDAMNSFSPSLYGFHTVINYVAFTLFFVLIGIVLQSLTQRWRKNLGLVSLLLLLLGLLLSGLQAEELMHWLLLGVCTGLVILFGYRFVIKATLTLIPLATAGVFILAGLKELTLNAYTGSAWSVGISLLLVVGVSGFLVFLVKDPSLD